MACKKNKQCQPFFYFFFIVHWCNFQPTPYWIRYLLMVSHWFVEVNVFFLRVVDQVWRLWTLNPEMIDYEIPYPPTLMRRTVFRCRSLTGNIVVVLVSHCSKWLLPNSMKRSSTGSESLNIRVVKHKKTPKFFFNFWRIMVMNSSGLGIL